MGFVQASASGAVISKDKRFRYTLWRIWDRSLPKLVVCMLNPSTADAKFNDPTIKKLLRLAKAWGYGGIWVVNFCAYRSPKPQAMLAALKRGEDIIGGQNVLRISNAVLGRDVLCAWGDGVRHLPQDHVERVKRSLRRHAHATYTWGLSKGGHPKHPLYAPLDAVLMDYAV